MLLQRLALPLDSNGREMTRRPARQNKPPDTYTWIAGLVDEQRYGKTIAYRHTRLEVRFHRNDWSESWSAFDGYLLRSTYAMIPKMRFAQAVSALPVPLSFVAVELN